MDQLSNRRTLGYLGVLGGGLCLALAPVMVTIKYMTGWAIIPAPDWVEPFRSDLGGFLTFDTPPRLWTVYGSVFTAGLMMVLLGLLGTAWRLIRSSGLALWGWLLTFALALQLGLGIGNVKLGLPLSVAVAHNAGALLLLAILVSLLARLRERRP